jgi:hypothetical protein
MSKNIKGQLSDKSPIDASQSTNMPLHIAVVFTHPPPELSSDQNEMVILRHWHDQTSLEEYGNNPAINHSLP